MSGLNAIFSCSVLSHIPPENRHVRLIASLSLCLAVTQRNGESSK